MNTIMFKALVTMALSLSLLGACGMFGRDDGPPEYYEVSESEPLVIPDHLDTPTSDTALNIEHQPVPLPEEPMSTVPPRVVVNQSRDGDNSMLRWASEGVYILVEESIEDVRGRMGTVIEDSGMELLGKAENGDYRFVFEDNRPEAEKGFWEKLSFWRDDPPDYSGSYLTLSRSDGEKTRVYLKYADGGEVPIEVAEHVLAILKETLG